ncbi:7174_t:CDS:2, partial [Funneliformis geosporum]
KNETDEYLKQQLIIHQSQLESGKKRAKELRDDLDKLRKELVGSNNLMKLLGLDKLKTTDKVMIIGGVILVIYLLKGNIIFKDLKETTQEFNEKIKDKNLEVKDVEKIQNTVKKYASPQTIDKADGKRKGLKTCHHPSEEIIPCEDDPDCKNLEELAKDYDLDTLDTLNLLHKIQFGTFTNQEQMQQVYQQRLERKTNRTPEEEAELENLRTRLRELEQQTEKQPQDCGGDIGCRIRNIIDTFAHGGTYNRASEGRPLEKVYPEDCKKTDITKRGEKFYIDNFFETLQSKKKITSGDIVETLSKVSEKHKDDNCEVKNSVKINDRNAIHDDSIVDTCTMFLSTELVHTFYRNKTQTSKTITTKVKEEL